MYRIKHLHFPVTTNIRCFDKQTGFLATFWVHVVLKCAQFIQYSYLYTAEFYFQINNIYWVEYHIRWELVTGIVTMCLTLHSADRLSWLHNAHCCHVELTGVDENNDCVQAKALATQIHSFIRDTKSSYLHLVLKHYLQE